MNWTGQLYGFYTGMPIEKVFERLKEKAQEIGYKFNYSKYKEEENLLFYRNEEMLDFHLENGYNTSMNNEGCFSIEAKIVKLDGIATLFEFDGIADFEPYDINLVFGKTFYYVLTVPDLIENSTFSKKIHHLFHDILMEII